MPPHAGETRHDARRCAEERDIISVISAPFALPGTAIFLLVSKSRDIPISDGD